MGRCLVVACLLVTVLAGAIVVGAQSGPIAVPGSFSIPLVGPLAITFTQSFDVSMQFAGRATVKAVGDYRLSSAVIDFDCHGLVPKASCVEV